MNNTATANLIATPEATATVNRTFNRRGFRRQSLCLRVFAAIERSEKARAEAMERGEFICTGCQSSIPIGTHTCHCGHYVATVIGNKVEDVCESCGAVEGTRHNSICG